MKKRDVKDTFRLKRESCLDILREQERTVLSEYKEACEDAMIPRARTILILAKDEDPGLDVLQDSFKELDRSMQLAETEFSLFEEIGKNSISCIIVDPSVVKHHESTIRTLKNCKFNIFVICNKKVPKLDLWLKEFGDIFTWPSDIGQLVSKVKACS